MATTIQCVLRALGNRNPLGFGKEDILAAFINAGYNPEKALRRYRQCAASHQIVPINESDAERLNLAENEKTQWVTLYCPAHWRTFIDTLADVQIVAVKIERDGTVTYL